MYTNKYKHLHIHIYSRIYKKLFIYTIAETTEPASKFYWINTVYKNNSKHLKKVL